MSNSSAKTSPIGARRVRTDLKTSENIFLAKYSSRSRKTSPIGIKQVPNHNQQQYQHLKEQNYYQTHKSIAPVICQQEQKQHNTRIPKATANLAQTQSSRRTSTATVATNRYTIAANAFSNVKCTNYLSTSAPTNTYATVPSAHLPARATRLLNRSRLQQQCPINNADSDSSMSAHSVRRGVAASRASSASTASNASLHRNTQLHQRDSHSSSDDLMLYDKSFRNAMIQEVLQFKKQLLRLRRILQEDEDGLTRTETLNPFETDNGQLFASCGIDSKLLDDIDLASLTSSTTDDPLQELADLRRQVVYLQGQVDDRDRTIRLQRNLIEKLEAEKAAGPNTQTEITKECINIATQTERTRPLAIGTENLSRSKPEYHSYTTHFPAICNDSTTVIQHQQQYPGNSNASNQTRRHTIISTTLTNYNHQQMGCQAPRRASIAWEQQQPEEQSTQTPNLIPKTYKPVRITLIGEPLKQWNGLNSSLNGEGKYMKNVNGSHAELENKKNLLNGSKEFVNGNSTNNINSSNSKNNNNNNNNNRNSIVSSFNGTSSCKQNGYHNNSAVVASNGLKQTTQQMENIVNNTQQHYQQQQQKQQQINGNLYPTVTIV